MGIKLADAVTYLTADPKELDRELGNAENRLTRWGGVAQGIMMGAGMAMFNAVASGVRSAVSQVGDAITSASDLGETISKTGVLFGENADALVAWAQKASTSIGQSQQSALDAATTFATFGRAAGLSGEDLVSFSTGFTELASDLASFNNTSPEQAIEAIGAALRGESEPLRAYGVLLDDASMRQAALKLGLIETTKDALTPQQKVLAAQALIYEQTAAAQGDFARTSEGLANQQRILTAQMDNLKATIGQALLPAITPLVTWANELAQKALPGVATFITESVVPAVGAFAERVMALVEVVGPVLEAFFGQVGQMFGGFKAGLENNATDADGWAGRLGTAFGAGARWLRENFFNKLPGWWGEFRDGLAGNVTAGDTWAARLGSLFGTAANNLKTNLFDKLPGLWADFQAGLNGSQTGSETWAGVLGRVVRETADAVSEDLGRLLIALNEVATWFEGRGQSSVRDWGDWWVVLIEGIGRGVRLLTETIATLVEGLALVGQAFQALQAGDWSRLAAIDLALKGLNSRMSPGGIMQQMWDELLADMQRRREQTPPPVAPAPSAPANQTFLPGVGGARGGGGAAGNQWTINIVGTGNGAQDLIGAAQFLQAMYG